MGAVTDEEKQLFREIKVDDVAYALLNRRRRYERMSAYAVLREWGDPRKWPSYKVQKPKA